MSRLFVIVKLCDVFFSKFVFIQYKKFHSLARFADSTAFKINKKAGLHTMAVVQRPTKNAFMCFTPGYRSPLLPSRAGHLSPGVVPICCCHNLIVSKTVQIYAIS